MPKITVANEPEPGTPRRQLSGLLTVDTDGRSFIDLTSALFGWLRREKAGDGLLTVFVRHTSASLAIQENADPDVRTDLLEALDRLAPEDAPYRHADEGPDDMPAHVKAVLTGASLSVPVSAGVPVLGMWQALYLVEHRRNPHRREIRLHYLGT
ncbi:MAG: secondary thiamine-phosphate synthase enzyme YjbQ [Bauldia sp.]|nr:secondary thiamine-phosphate synthase enzyme YjbQ [Bauldia sp.]